MVWHEISADDLNKLTDPLIIDVRSPCEHRQERIPRCVNVPLLSDGQRQEIGIIYKQEGESKARMKALSIISPSIPQLVERILELREHGRPLVVYCWRGGLRSEAVASFLSILGIECRRLTGGYKAWRRLVREELDTGNYRFIPVILHGHTGAGKTEILNALASLGCSVVDLEGLACHRGSVFGGMGMGQQPTQKNFDALIWQELRFLGAEPVFMEAESRKVGRLSLPDCVLRSIQTGHKILVSGSLPCRVKRIVGDYSASLTLPEMLGLFDQISPVIRRRIGAMRANRIRELAAAGQLDQAVEALLIEYYDPLYRKQIERFKPYELEISGNDPRAGAHAIAGWAERSLAP